ncbi:MAG: hypothetical protein V1839_00365 [archaeon]
MLYGKKAVRFPPEFIVGIIVAIIFSLVVLLGVISPVSKAVGERGFQDNLCHLNAGIRGSLDIGKVIIPLWFCSERNAPVHANDWETCDPGGKLGLKEQNNDAARKKCASIQLYNLASRCWYMYGSGGWHLSRDKQTSYDCFASQVYGLNGKITPDDIKKAVPERPLKYIGTNNVCSSHRYDIHVTQVTEDANDKIFGQFSGIASAFGIVGAIGAMYQTGYATTVIIQDTTGSC